MATREGCEKMSREDMMELRDRLAAHGIEYKGGWDDNGMTTAWKSPSGQWFQCYQSGWNGSLSLLVGDATPEQAIAATLGSEQPLYGREQIDALETKWANAQAATLGSGECEQEESGWNTEAVDEPIALWLPEDVNGEPIRIGYDVQHEKTGEMFHVVGVDQSGIFYPKGNRLVTEYLYKDAGNLKIIERY